MWHNLQGFAYYILIEVMSIGGYLNTVKMY